MELGPADRSLLLPEGTRLVHIGPPKTGTTTLQGALHLARSAMLVQGVRYAGRGRHPRAAVLAVTGRSSFTGVLSSSPISRWTSLAHEVRTAAEPRVVVSSELLADATPEVIPRIIEDLGGDLTHVVLTLRPLAKLLPSQWQQYVKSGLRRGFEPWLHAVLEEDGGTTTPTFWRRHRHDALIRRWAAVTGVERISVVVVDDRAPDGSLRVFEKLLGLETGTLVSDRSLANRSLTLPEIEAVRAFNIAFRKADLDPDLLQKVMHFGAAKHMTTRTPSPEWQRIMLPAWAADRATEIAREMVDGIRGSGVRVVGDLELLATGPLDGAVESVPAVVGIPPEVAASMTIGVLTASGLARHGDTEDAEQGGEPSGVELVPTLHLAGIVARRARGLLTRRARSVGRRLRRG